MPDRAFTAILYDAAGATEEWHGIGESRGPFVIHADIRGNGWTGWTVTHARTGAFVRQGLCCVEAARTLADVLVAVCPDWDFAGHLDLNAGVMRPPVRVTLAAREMALGWTCPVHGGSDGR